MLVFDTNDLPIIPDHFADKLIGTMCEITFTLKHYAIWKHMKPDGNVTEANDVFCAQVETVAILKKPPILGTFLSDKVVETRGLRSSGVFSCWPSDALLLTWITWLLYFLFNSSTFVYPSIIIASLFIYLLIIFFLLMPFPPPFSHKESLFWDFIELHRPLHIEAS